MGHPGHYSHDRRGWVSIKDRVTVCVKNTVMVCVTVGSRFCLTRTPLIQWQWDEGFGCRDKMKAEGGVSEWGPLTQPGPSPSRPLAPPPMRAGIRWHGRGQRSGGRDPGAPPAKRRLPVRVPRRPRRPAAHFPLPYCPRPRGTQCIRCPRAGKLML